MEQRNSLRNRVRLPGVPRNVVVTNTTTSSISLAWEEPEDTGHETVIADTV